jgi:2-C-methyl-D-erythritol 4-phosphate cytidylyltransferase
MVVAVLAAAGAGERLGAGSAKALVQLAGRPLLAWCLDALAASTTVEQAIVAAPPGQERLVSELTERAATGLGVDVVAGASSRSRSVANGVERAVGADVVVVHDAARPLVTAELVDRCVRALERWGCDGAIAAAQVTDAIKQTDRDGRVVSTLDRDGLWAVQTPQAFAAPVLRRALDGGELDSAYDDAQLVEAVGGDVRVVEAPRENLKVTTPLDLRVAELLVRERVPPSGG